MRFKTQFEKKLVDIGWSYQIDGANRYFILNQVRVQLVEQDDEVQIDDSIIIHEFQWRFNQEICLGRIRNKLNLNLKIHGRQTKVKRIDKAISSEFLEENHLLGFRNAKFKYGCFLKNELVAVMTFSSARNIEGLRSFELVQFASKIGYSVVGGLDKLLKHFIQEHKPNNIVTIIDKEFSTPENWLKLGFEIEKENSPFEISIDKSTWRIRKSNANDNPDNYFFKMNSGSFKLKLDLSKN